jgi:nitronate monooxygenase
LGFKREELKGDVFPLSHLVQETIEGIVPFEMLYRKEIPVIAAGGIYTGEDIFEIMKAGAKAVKLGTRFVATHECDASLILTKVILRVIRTILLLSIVRLDCPEEQ